MTAELSQWDLNFLSLSNSALACSPSLLSRLITWLWLSAITDGLEEGSCSRESRDTQDTVELQDSVEGQGDGGVANALSVLFKSGLSVPESMLECLVWVTVGEVEVRWCGCCARLPSSTISWMLSWRAA